jgi:hypothetical protein
MKRCFPTTRGGLSQMTFEGNVRLLAGEDAWHTAVLQRPSDRKRRPALPDDLRDEAPGSF